MTFKTQITLAACAVALSLGIVLAAPATYAQGMSKDEMKKDEMMKKEDKMKKDKMMKDDKMKKDDMKK